MADIFDVVSDPTRRRLLNVLREHGNEISVGQLVGRLELSQPTVSKHLRVLREQGLVSVREDGQHRYYRLDTEPLEQLQGWLAPFIVVDVAETTVIEEPVGAIAAPSVFGAWSGADVGATIGRTVADRSHSVRSVIRDVADAIRDATDRVAGLLPSAVRDRLFRAR